MLRQTVDSIRGRINGGDLSDDGAAKRSRSAGQLREAAQASVDDLCASLQTSMRGLAESVAEERLQTNGPNQVAHERPPAWYVQLWHGFANAFSGLLAVLATVSWFTGDRESALIIAAMVLLSGLLRFFQERRASLAAQKLQEMVRVTCTVIRCDAAATVGEREIPIRGLVPGDLVKLSAGDMVPADVRLVSAKDLFVAQSALTGEALPVEKTAASAPSPAMNPLELANIAFLGTNVTSGTAAGLVVHTGEATLLMRPGLFSPARALVMRAYDHQYLLVPAGLMRSGDEFDLGRYRILRQLP